MSIFGAVYYDEMRMVDHEPAWSKAERYGYCEPADLRAAGVISRVIGSLKSVLAK